MKCDGEVSNLDMERYTSPAYPAAEAGRLVGLHPARVRRWVKGYSYRHASIVRRQSPVVRRTARAAISSYVSFFELIGLLLVKQLLDNDISLQRIRKALSEAESIVGGGHLAQRVYFSDGNDNLLIHLMSGRQWGIPAVIEELGNQIEFFGPPREYARLWYPRGSDGHIVVNPIVCFGSPSLIGRGITTANIYDLFVAEGNNHQAVEDWWGITRSEVMAVVEFERSLEAQA